MVPPSPRVCPDLRVLALACLVGLPGCTLGLTLANPEDGGGGPGPGDDTGLDDTGSTDDSDTGRDSGRDSDTGGRDSDTGGRDSDTGEETDTQEVVISIESVDPEYGTTAGGEEITITGGPFDSSTGVWFGANAATVVSVTSSRIVVDAPAGNAEAEVDVRVRTDDGEGTLVSGYAYYEDGTGMTGVVGEIWWLDQVGTYWGSATTDSGGAWVQFVHPIAEGYGELLFNSGTDGCTSGYTGTTPRAYDPSLADIDVSTPTGAYINLTWDATGQAFSLDDMSNTKYTPGGSYDLGTIRPTGLPAFAVPDLAEVPSGFSVSVPSIGGSSVPRVSRSSFNLTWSGSGGDYMVAYLAMWNAGGTDWGEVATCVLRDDGSFTVPSATFSSWPTDRQLDIILGRVKIAGGTVPFNNADSQVAGVYMVYGATFTQ